MTHDLHSDQHFPFMQYKIRLHNRNPIDSQPHIFGNGLPKFTNEPILIEGFKDLIKTTCD